MKPKDFSIIVIPDTQNISTAHPDKLYHMASWIADHADELSLKAVLHVGDMINRGALEETEWLQHKRAFDLLDHAGIPTLYAIGNHDYDNILRENRDSAAFNKYCGLERFLDKPWFGGAYEEGKAENMYAVLEPEGLRLLILILEFGPRDEVIDWANRILEGHPDHRAIIVTHSYLYISGDRTKPGDSHNPKDFKGAHGANDGEDLWNKCVKRHANVMAVYSGHHVNGHICWRMDSGDHNNTVFQSFQNWQGAPNGGDGRFRLLRYRLEENIVDHQVFNPQTSSYEELDGYSASHAIYGTERNSGEVPEI